MTEPRIMPHNIEAEQIVLGYILYDNDSINKFGDYLRAEHFYSPIHQKIYEQIINIIDRGLIVKPIILKNIFDNDPAFDNGDSLSYFNSITAMATSVVNISDYARLVYDLAIKRKLINIGEEIISTAFDCSTHSSSKEQIEKSEEKLFHLATEGVSDTGFSHYKFSLETSIKQIEFAIQNRDNVIGISTGFRDLDKCLAGLQNSDLLILAGRPSMGKTAFAINMAFNACKFLMNNKKYYDGDKPPSVGFFSLEMSAPQLTARILSMASELEASSLRSGNIHKNDFSKIVEASREIGKYPFFIDDTPALTISSLRARARRLKRTHNLSALFIDYLQLIRGSNNVYRNRVQEISEITQGLKAIAKELNIPVIALSQLSRAVEQREDKRPLLSDLRESGSIEQDADVVMFIFREAYYLERKAGTNPDPEMEARLNSIRNNTEIIVAKQRNGPIDNIRLLFNSKTTKFTDDNRTDMR